MTKGMIFLNFWLTNVRLETAYTQEGSWINGSQTDFFALEIKDGTFQQLLPQPDFDTQLKHQETIPLVDGQGALLLPGLVEKHCHLDKSKLGTAWQPVTPAHSIVERFESEIPQLDALPLSIMERAQALLTCELAHGATKIRSHIDIEPMTGLRYLKAIQQLVAEQPFETELVAFPQHGLLRSQSSDLVAAALEAGASLIGGVDPYTLDGDMEASLAETFALAQRYDVDIDLHLHDRGHAGRATIREILRLTEQTHYQDRVHISHAFGLNDFSEEERATLFPKLAANRIHIISSVPLDAGTIPPIPELLAAGVPVHLGCDNVYDSWSPYGNGSLQEKAARLGEMYGLKGQVELTQLLGLMTDGRVPLDQKGQHVWPQVHDEATFLLTQATCTAEFVARQTPVFASFAKGNPVQAFPAL